MSTQSYNPALRVCHVHPSTMVNENHLLANMILSGFSLSPEGRIYIFFHETSFIRMALNPHKIICYDWLLAKRAKLENDLTELRQRHTRIATEANLYNTYTPELRLYIGCKSITCSDHVLPRDTLVRSNAEYMWAIHLSLYQSVIDKLRLISSTITRAEELTRSYNVLIQLIVAKISQHFWRQEILLLDGDYLFQITVREGTVISKSQLESKIFDTSNIIRNLQFSPETIITPESTVNPNHPSPSAQGTIL